jgi:outer membrane receptor protein involved in Fe transport
VDALRLLGSAQAEVPGFLTPRGRLVAGTDFSAGSVRSAYRPVAAGDAAAFLAAPGARGEVSARGRGVRSAAAAFARYELAPVDAVRLSLGGRVDWLRDSFDPSIPDTAASLRASHTAFSPRAGVNVRFVRTARQEGHAYLAAGKSFKAPTPDQLYDQRAFPVPFPPFGITVSNPLLRPQHGTSLETGLYHRASPGGGVATELSLAAYRMEMRDELDFDIQSFRYVNLGRSRHRGLEASARVGGAPASLFAAYTLQDVTSRTGENAGRALKAIPRHFLAGGVDVGRGDGPAAALSASRAWGIWLDDAGTRRLPGFTRVDGRLSWPVRRVRITLDAFNLLDRKYSTTGFLDPAGSGTAYYFPAAGRTLQLGVGSSF